METLKCAFYKTESGVFKICYAENKIIKIDFFGDVEIKETSNPSEISDKAISQIKEFLTGKRKEFDLPIAYNGTEFQMKVWNYITTIPYGKTQSYKEIAEAVGSPKAMRAVGSTHSKNPLLVVIPCHRVVKSSNKNGKIKYADKIQEILLKVEHKKYEVNLKSIEMIVNNKDVTYLVSKELIFKQIKDKYGLPPNWSRPEGFETLVQIILEQQVSLSSARAHFVKLKSSIKTITPKNILQLSDDMMRENQISRQKSSYLKALSTAVLNNELVLEKLSNLNEEQVREKLTKIKGIGNWTADVYLLQCLQSKDIFPIGDIALINTMKEFTNLKDKEEILNFANKWKPCRSLATYFLWHNYLKKRNRTFEVI